MRSTCGNRAGGSLLASVALLVATAAGAATINVGTTDDASAISCTLRDAISAANTDAPVGGCQAGAGDDVVDLTRLSGVILLASALPDVTSNLQIHGPGAANLAVDGQNTVRVLRMTGGTVTITDLTIARGLGPSLSQGGGILILGGTLSLLRVVVRHCGAYNGGGISHNGGGTLTIEDSTINGNRTTGNSGAGILVNDSTLFLRNSTIADNVISDPDRPGGGLLQIGGASTITSCTFAYNTATTADGSAIANVPPTGAIHVANTIFFSNSGGNCQGPITSDGHNLSDDATCGVAAPGDRPNTPADLGNLTDNGGPTRTIAFAPGSAATDGGDPARCPPADQRGVARPVDGDGDGLAVCDIGAFERACSEGLPAGTPCGPDSTPCSDDVCDGAGTCQHPNNNAPCDDGDPCTLGDTCANGVCQAGATVTCPVTGGAVTAQPIGGARLLIVDRSPRKRMVVFTSKDERLDSSPGSGIDPLAGGAVLQIFNDAGTGDSACFDLATAGWSAKGKGAKRTLRYRDKRSTRGPCQLAAVKDAKVLHVECRGTVKPIDYSLDEPAQQRVGVRFRSGATEYCALFGGAVTKDRQRRVFEARGAPAPGTCSVPPVPCP
jgi:hypothetical protein